MDRSARRELLEEERKREHGRKKKLARSLFCALSARLGPIRGSSAETWPISGHVTQKGLSAAGLARHAKQSA